MKTVKVSHLKAHLSEYLAAVRRGETVIVSDRDTPIARLVPYREEIEGFRIEKASRPPSSLKKIRGVRLRKQMDVVELLRESRDDR